MSENSWKNRWSKDEIKAMLLEQYDNFWQQETGVERECLPKIMATANSPYAIIISGLRRVGKSTLLAQFAHKLGKEAFYYLNFEDNRFLGFQPEESTYLHEVLIETFGERHFFLVDEIQNINGWEHFVRSFMDLGFKFCITGSNASLLSQELGTRLTGRYIPIELFPFSFREYRKFFNIPLPDLQRMKTPDKANLNASLEQYLHQGGIPLELANPAIQSLQTLYNDVLFRDIASRYQIEALSSLKELGFFAVSNPANLVSFNKLKNQMGLKSSSTVKNYFDYLENSWLIFTINLYDFSVKRQQIAPKKMYCIDNGLSRVVGFHPSPDSGRMLENLVFLQLRRQTNRIYYVRPPQSNAEADFYLPERRLLIQVSQQMENPGTRQRELSAMEKGIDFYHPEKALVLCNANENSYQFQNTTVEIRSVAEWLLDSPAGD